MRIRPVVAIVLLMLPVGLSAQRFPRIGGRVPSHPTPLPPQPPAIARELAYKRSRVAFETYPLLTYVQSAGAAANVVAPNNTSFGVGTRADYRVTRFVSMTLDMTSSLLGGSANTETAELGARLRPERTDRKVYPFLDLRGGFVHAYDTFTRPFDVIGGSNGPGYGARYAQGFGAVVGAGMEYALTRRFSLTTAASVLRSRMTAYNIYGPAPANGRYSMTAYRFTFGVRFNPVRLLRANETESP